MKTYKFIKTVSDTVFDMINTAYHYKPLILIEATFREKLVIKNPRPVTINGISHIKYNEFWG